MVVKCEIVQFEDFSEEASKVFSGRLDLASFCQSSSIVASPLSVSLFVYKLETSNVARILFSGSLPKFFSRMMRSVVSLK